MTDTTNMLKDLRVLVTAGASGIGLVIAENFAREGARVHICDNSEEALTACTTAHPDWGISRCDVSHEKQVKTMFSNVAEAMGGLDVLVNNAGIAGPTGNIEELSSDEWLRTVDVNLNGQFLLCTSGGTDVKAI